MSAVQSLCMAAGGIAVVYAPNEIISWYSKHSQHEQQRSHLNNPLPFGDVTTEPRVGQQGSQDRVQTCKHLIGNCGRLISRLCLDRDSKEGHPSDAQPLGKGNDNASHPNNGIVVYGDPSVGSIALPQKDTNPADNYGDSIYGDQLTFAASRGLVPEMLRLIKAGANINGPNREAMPLLWATVNSQEGAVQVLIENGAQVDRVDKEGDTALCYAAYAGNTAIIDLLCKHHANIEHKNMRKFTPLILAILGEHADAVEILLDRGAKQESSDDDPYSPLQAAIEKGFESAIGVLLRKGANVRAIDQDGYTPLMFAVSSGKWNVAESLLEKGAGVDLVPGSLCSPLAVAINSGQAAMVELLAKYGADIDHLEDFNPTTLMYAAELGMDTVVQSLIDMGADLDRTDYKGRTALSYAKEKGHKSTIELLLQAQTLRRDSQYWKKAEEQRKDPKTSFEYRPLPEGFIRILELQPGQEGNVVCFSLINVELSQSPSFEALSYEWKGKVGRVPTRCDGERILITPNCYAALEILRSETETRILWVDAICINQQDASERGNQVALMCDIFSKATSVLMWIGEEEDYSDLAFASIPALSHAKEEIQKTPESRATPTKQGERVLLLGRPEIQDFTEKTKVAAATWRAWHMLCRRSYFTRGWIFQEIILAGPRGIVLCGTRRCSWDAFKAALEAYATLRMDYSHSLLVIVANDKQFRSLRSLKFELAMWAMSGFKVGDSRDKVFAALGLSFGKGTHYKPWESVQVADYTKSVAEVFINANRYIIDNCGKDKLWDILDPINQSTATGGTKTLPSWAFDFMIPVIIRSNPFSTDNAEYGTLLCGRPTTTQVSLHINGYVVDEVNCKVPITKDKSTVDVVKTVVRYVAALGRGIYDPSPSIGKRSVLSKSQKRRGKTFSKTNLAALLGTLMSLDDCSADEEMQFATYVVWQLMTDNETSQIFKAPPDFFRDGIEGWRKSSQELANFDLAICKKMETQHRYKYDLVYTEKGYFGLAPRRQGDEGLVVTVIGGCKNLVLLRKKSSGGDTWYEYVSKVFMYGWTKDKIKTVEDLGDDLKQVRFEIQ